MIGTEKTIGLACDHGGFERKEFIAQLLVAKGYAIKDFGCHSDQSVDYPDFGHQLGGAIERGELEYGFAVCGSANGISISLNRHRGVRAAICWKEELAKLARGHNDANVCSVPGRFVTEAECEAIVDAFLGAEYEGGRHQQRVEKIEL